MLWSAHRHAHVTGHNEPAPKPTPPAALLAIVFFSPSYLLFFGSSTAGCVSPIELVAECEELEWLYEFKLDALYVALGAMCADAR